MSPSAGDAIANYAVSGRTPRYVVRPGSVEAMQGLFREVSAAGEAAVVQGGRSGIATGNPLSRYDVAIETSGLDGLIAHEPEDYTVTVQAGMRFEALQALLSQHGQYLPLDPPQPSRTTIGGIIARGRGGLRRGAFGEVRDWLIGCTAVLSDGRAVHGGGRVVKNVSGYDLPKLFAGSWGTLGCIVEASFKLRPLPLHDASVRIPAADFAAAVEAGSEIAHRIAGLESVLALDASSAAAAGLEGDAALLIRAGGMPAVVEETLATARGIVGRGATTDSATAASAWGRLSGRTGPADQGLLVRISAPPPAIATLSARAAERVPGSAQMALLDGGGIWLRADEAADPAALVALREATVALGGALTIESAAVSGVDTWGEASGLPIMRRVKAAFDPSGTLSPGRFVRGLEG